MCQLGYWVIWRNILDYRGYSDKNDRMEWSGNTDNTDKGPRSTFGGFNRLSLATRIPF
jgi:hypothetical protein